MFNANNYIEFAYPPSPEKRAKKTGLFPLEVEDNSQNGNRIPQAPGSVGATALSGLSIYSPKPNNQVAGGGLNVIVGELFSPGTPKSDFNSYVDNALSPLGIGMSPSSSTPSDMNHRVPTSKDWSISQSPFVGGFPAGVGEEFAFSDVGSPPPRMRHKAKRFDDTSPGNLLSPSNLILSPLGAQDQSHANNKKALAHRMKGDNLRGQLNNSSQLFLNPVKTDLLSGNSPSKHKLGIAESSDSLGFAAITEAARTIKQKPSNTIGKSGSSKKNESSDTYNSNNKSPRRNDKDDDIRGSTESISHSDKKGNTESSQTPTTTTTTTTYAKTVSCNCKKSRCLKLYCDCFRISKFCDGCNCVDCANNLEHSEGERAKVINQILDRNPEAFKPRVMAVEDTTEKSHLSGCHCKKSACLKKYCECFTGGVPCNSLCRCIDCKNINDLYANGELIGIKTVQSSTKKVSNSSNRNKNNEELNNSTESTSSPINTLLELAGAGVNQDQDEKEREATESLLALSPKPSRTHISDMSSQSDAEESIYKTEKAGALFI